MARETTAPRIECSGAARRSAAVALLALAMLLTAACSVDRTPLLNPGQNASDMAPDMALDMALDMAQRDADAPSIPDTPNVEPDAEADAPADLPPDVPEDAGGHLRVEDGLVVQYLFDDFDSERGIVPGHPEETGLDLTVAVGVLHTVPGVGAAIIEEARMVQENWSAANEAFIASGEITIEVWCRPETIRQTGPSRLVEIGNNTSFRNVLLGQQNGQAAIRVLDHMGTETTTVYSDGVFTEDTVVHVVLSVDSDSGMGLYVDGDLHELFVADEPGTFAGWDPEYVLSVANNAAGGRAWLGDLYLVALYDRVLVPEEVRQNYEAGPRGEGPVPSAQQVHFDIENSRGCREGEDCNLVVTRSGDVTEELAVPYRILGSAVEGEDFDPIPREVVFPPEESTQTLTVSSLQTGGPESPELLTFRLLPSAQYTVAGPARHPLVIYDYEYPPWDRLHSWMSAALVVGAQGERRPDWIDLKSEQYIDVLPFTIRNQPKPGLQLHWGLEFAPEGITGDDRLYVLMVLSEFSSSSETKAFVSLGTELEVPVRLVLIEGSMVLYFGTQSLGSWQPPENFYPVMLVELWLKPEPNGLFIQVIVGSEIVIQNTVEGTWPDAWLGNYVGGIWTDDSTLSTSSRARLMMLHDVMLYQSSSNGPALNAREFLRSVHGL